MNRQICGMVVAGLLLIVTACTPAAETPAAPTLLPPTAAPTTALSDTEPTPTRETVDLANVIQVQVRPTIIYQFENPGGRWSLGGRDVNALGYPSTFIQIDVVARPEGVTFAEALQAVTAEEFAIQTENGVTYAEVTNNIGARIIYRDSEDAIIAVLVLDSIDDEVQEQYIADWRDIALNGELVILR